MMTNVARSWLPQLIRGDGPAHVEEEPVVARVPPVDVNLTVRCDKLEKSLRDAGCQWTPAINYALTLARDLERNLNEAKVQLRSAEVEAERLGDQLHALRAANKVKAAKKTAAKPVRKVA
jgi:hypothetical protein